MNISLKPCSLGEHQERTANKIGVGRVTLLRNDNQYGIHFFSINITVKCYLTLNVSVLPFSISF